MCKVVKGSKVVTAYPTSRPAKYDGIAKHRCEAKKQEKKKKYTGPQPSEGAVYTGRITGVKDYGVFLEIMPGLEGLCHVSELHTEWVTNCKDFVASLGVEEFKVMCLGKNDRGKLRLSRKAVLSDGRSNSNSI